MYIGCHSVCYDDLLAEAQPRAVRPAQYNGQLVVLRTPPMRVSLRHHDKERFESHTADNRPPRYREHGYLGRSAASARAAYDRGPCTCPRLPLTPRSQGVEVPSGFSIDMHQTNLRISASILGRPTLPLRNFHRKYNLQPCWCQRTSVAGWTMTSTERQFDQKRGSQAQKMRSRFLNLGRLCGCGPDPADRCPFRRIAAHTPRFVPLRQRHPLQPPATR